VSLASSLYGFAVAFAATTLLWMARLVGGGDSKLFSAAALFFGLKYLGLLAVATGLAGGLVAVVMILRRPTRALVLLQMRGRGESAGVPYGVAIAAGAIVAGWLTGFLGLHASVGKMNLDYLTHSNH
jgi:prepilin peptidase CpaA